MADYDLQALHHHMLGILQTIDTVCREHRLRYYITAGTQLGAVRHGGFIPWDDDADICMPRPDYEQLLAHAREWLPRRYELVSPETASHYPQPFAKLQDAQTTLIEHDHLRFLGGVYVDVFPLDGVPSAALSRRLHFARYKLLRKLLYFTFRDPYRHGHGPSSWVPLLCRRLFTVEGLQQRIRRLLLSCDYDGSTLVADYDDGLRGTMPRSMPGSPTPVLFMGVSLMGYEHPRDYLAQKYGPDYMTPPPAPARRQHNFFYLDLGKPYREYRG